MSCKYPKETKSYKCCGLCDDKNTCVDSITNEGNDNLLSASEAFHKTKDVIKKCTTKELLEIKDKIAKAIDDGKFSINGYGSLTSETVERLTALGYRVKPNCERDGEINELNFSISWK